MERRKEYHLEAANLPGREYMEDKPRDCAYCYWWKARKRECGRSSCYYLLPEREVNIQKEEAEIGDCRSCPYGKHSPCIGFCLAKILWEMRKQS